MYDESLLARPVCTSQSSGQWNEGRRRVEDSWLGKRIAISARLLIEPITMTKLWSLSHVHALPYFNLYSNLIKITTISFILQI